MLLEALRLQNFRNIEFAELQPHSRFNIFWGDNGQGKTNLVEAVYLLSAAKSFRPQTNADLIRFGQHEATLEARVDRGGNQRVVRLEVGDRGKKIFLNNNPVRNLSDFFGTVNVVVFGPEDIMILKGGPSERRRFVDRAIFNAQPAYAHESQAYDEVLKQRNAMLKSDKVDDTLLSIYDEQLVQYGSDIISRRLDFLEGFRPVLAATFASIFDDSFRADLGYDMTWSDRGGEHVMARERLERSEIERRLHAALAATRDEEHARGYTVVGPHRDDLAASLNERDVKTYASQGQHRAFVLAMKIAEIRYLEERYRFAPILLLDDVSSELDRDRNRYLFDFLRSRMEGQVFITTTHRDYILLDEDVASWNVRSGEFSRDD
jgi:DNA replication and repair protein RecF